MRKSAALRDAQDKESAQTVADVLSGTTITITARWPRVVPFGSVTTADIAEALHGPDRRRGRPPQVVQLAEPLKSVGTHTVPVQLHSDVTADVTVEVVAEAPTWGRPRRPTTVTPGCQRGPRATSTPTPRPNRLSPGLPTQEAGVHTVVHLETTVVHLKFAGLHPSLPPGALSEGRGTMAQPVEEAPVRRLHAVGGPVLPHNVLDAEESLLGGHVALSRRHRCRAGGAAWPRTSTSPPTDTCSRR